MSVPLSEQGRKPTKSGTESQPTGARREKFLVLTQLHKTIGFYVSDTILGKTLFLSFSLFQRLNRKQE